MLPEHIDAVVELQHHSFPLPFDPDLHWKAEHLQQHIKRFPSGQWVVQQNGILVGSCSNTLISEQNWTTGKTWDDMVGGYSLESYEEKGSTLFGLDISVHSEFRKRGIGRSLYASRKRLASDLKLARYGTVCRIPDYGAKSSEMSATDFVAQVCEGKISDRTLSPLLRYGLRVVDVMEEFMDDAESRNVGCKLELVDLEGV